MQREQIHKGAKQLRDLHEAVLRYYATYRQSRSDSDLQAWKRATSEYHARYEHLAFPGGLDKIFSGLSAGELVAINNGITFLEADPWFFRSGYLKADILNTLIRTKLTNEQMSRLQSVVLERIKGPDRREFRYYCRMAKKISDPVFEERVQLLASETDEITSRHAGWVLAYLKGEPIVRSYFRHSSG
jgi:hypothetical protein